MNVRQSQLTNQRERSGLSRKGWMGLGTRILNPSLQPANNAISSIAQKVDRQTDEIMYKKWQAGEISDDEYLALKEKATSRPYVSPEEKSLLTTEVKTLRRDIEDKKMYEAYKSGRVSKRQLFSYENGKLSSLVPGSQAYDLQMSTINELSKQIMQEDRQKYRNAQEVQIAKMPGRNTPEEYEKRAILFQQLADQATRDGQDDEASDYLQKSYEYHDAGIELKAKLEEEQRQLDEKNQVKQAEKNKQSFTDSVNLLIDDYRNNRIDSQGFMTKLSEYGQTAKTSGYIDELDTLTDWFNTAREDSAKGYKDWSRGGTGKDKAGGLTEDKRTEIQGKLEDLEFEKAKQALIENIKDKNKLVAAMAELNNRYLNGSPASESDPDGWIGLTNRYLDEYEKITTTGKGSIDTLNALEKKITSKQKDSKVLQDALKNPNNYGVLYKNDGTAEIFHSGEIVTDPKTGNKSYYLQDKKYGNLGNGRYIEGKELLQVNPKGKSVGGTYYGTFEGKTYQWKPGEQAVPKEKAYTQQPQGFDFGKAINAAGSWAQGVPGEVGKFFNSFQVPEIKPVNLKNNKQSLDTSRLFAKAGMSDINTQARGYSKANIPQPTKLSLSTRILPSFSTINKSMQPVVKQVSDVVNPVVNNVSKVIAPIIPKVPEMNMRPAEQLGITPQTKIQSPTPITPVPTPSASAIRTAPAGQGLSIAGIVKPSPVQKWATDTNQKPVSIQGPGLDANQVQQQMKQAQQRDTSVGGSLKALANNVIKFGTSIWPFKKK